MIQKDTDPRQPIELLPAYIENQVEFLHRMTGRPKWELKEQVTNLVRQRCNTKKKAEVVRTVSYGNDTIVHESLLALLNYAAKHVIVPSGSIYMRSDREKSVITEFIQNRLKKRAYHKGLQLKAAGVGDKEEESIQKLLQSTCKINLNSLPGGFGSPHNLFYNKPNYNAITSSCRTMIMRAVTLTEQLLSGNFAFFSEEEVINHLIHLCRLMPAQETVQSLMTQYALKQPSYEATLKYFQDGYSLYNPGDPRLKMVPGLLQTFTPVQLAYVYYYHNLKHLFMENEHTFRPLFTETFDISKINWSPDGGELDRFGSFGAELIAMTLLVFKDQFKVTDLKAAIKKDPDLGVRFVKAAEYLMKHIGGLKQLFDAFVNIDYNCPNVAVKKNMVRNTVILSDTDSVIFTVKSWVEWFVGEINDSPAAYQISGLLVYFLCTVNTEMLHRFSIGQGTTAQFTDDMQMKNEFLFITLLLFDLKKTYASLITIQEGVVKPKAEVEIKGNNLRSSAICPESQDFTEALIIDKILKPSIHGRFSASTIIAPIVEYENKIKQDIRAGCTTYFKYASINMEKSYANPLSSMYFYYLAWEHLFAKEHGTIRVPTKCPIVNIIAPDLFFLDNLQKTNPEMHRRFTSFHQIYKKWPGSIALNPASAKVPPELIPLIDVRSVITHNLNPSHLVAGSLGIRACFADQKLLFSDLFKVPSAG